MASPYNGWTKFFDVEYRVVGAWNQLLTQYFPLGNAVGSWWIGAEVYPKPTDTKGDMADLAVATITAGAAATDVILSNTYLYYEAKGSSGSWGPTQKQAEKWLTNAIAGGNDFDCWAVLAIGPQVQFWKWYGSQFEQQEWYPAAGGIGGRLDQPKQGKTARTFNIQDNAQWIIINQAVAYMAANPAQ